MLLNYLVKRGHLREYIEKVILNGLQASPSTSSRLVIDIILASPTMPKTQGQQRSGVFVLGVKYSLAPSSIQLINGVITFTKSPVGQLSMPHSDALVLTLEVERHLMKRILVD